MTAHSPALLAATWLLLAAWTPLAAKPAPTRAVTDDEALMGEVIERKLASWKPGPDNSARPAAGLLQPAGEISGTWHVRRGMDRSTLWIRRISPGRYAVSFYTTGCLSRWRLQRTGEFAGGVLTLERPVEDYFPLTYQRLYLVRAGGEDYLVADAAVQKFERGVTADGSRITDPFQVRFFAYRRLDALAEEDPVATVAAQNQAVLRAVVDEIVRTKSFRPKRKTEPYRIVVDGTGWEGFINTNPHVVVDSMRRVGALAEKDPDYQILEFSHGAWLGAWQQLFPGFSSYFYFYRPTYPRPDEAKMEYRVGPWGHGLGWGTVTLERRGDAWRVTTHDGPHYRF